MENIFKKRDGFELVEALVAIAVLTLGGVSLIYAFNSFIVAAENSLLETKAGYAGEEGLEAMRFIRDQGYTANILPLRGAGARYLYWNSVAVSWEATTTPYTMDGMFIRRAAIDSVNRDANHDIAVSGTADPDISKITVSVEWSKNGASTTKTFATYLTNMFDN